MGLPVRGQRTRTQVSEIWGTGMCVVVRWWWLMDWWVQVSTARKLNRVERRG